MKIAIRKENNGSIYIDKTALCRFTIEELALPPYNFTIVEIDVEDCEASDFDEDLKFNREKYNARKLTEEENLRAKKIVAKIRERYTINDELAILRQRDSKPEAFAEYNEYVEQCKRSV